MAPGQAIEALAEYVVCLERPLEAKGAWLRTQINDALAAQGTHLQLAALGVANRVRWATWLDEKTAHLIQREAVPEKRSEDLGKPVLPLRSPLAQQADALRHYNDGVALINSGRREEALKEFDLAVALAPDFEEAWFNKGNVFHHAGRYDEAIACYEHAPGRFQAWCNKGQALRTLGRNDAALASYDHALRLRPEDKITWLNRGVALSKLNRSREALLSYDRALELDQHYADAWVNKAGLLGQMHRYDEAFECYDRGLRLNPNDSLGWLSKANLLSDQERWSEAVLCYEKALALDGRLEQAWLEKGTCLGRLQRHGDALQCFNAVLTLNPENRDAWFNKGVSSARGLQDYREGLICFQQAHRLGHPNAASLISTCRREIADEKRP